MEMPERDDKRTWGRMDLSYTRIFPNPKNPLIVEQEEHSKRLSVSAPHFVQCTIWTLLITKLAGDHPMLQTAFKYIAAWLGGQ